MIILLGAVFAGLVSFKRFFVNQTEINAIQLWFDVSGASSLVVLFIVFSSKFLGLSWNFKILSWKCPEILIRKRCGHPKMVSLYHMVRFLDRVYLKKKKMKNQLDF